MRVRTRIKLSTNTQRALRNWEKECKNFQRDIDELDRHIKRVGIRMIQTVITERGLIDTGAMRSSTNIDAVSVDKGVEFTSAVKYASYVNQGVRAHVMKYLRGKGPIPLSSKKMPIASDASFDRGAWKHPGTIKGKGFMQEAIQRTLKEVLPKIRVLRKKMMKARK